MLRSIKISDANQICDIYNYYIANTIVTFEKTPVDEDSMQERIRQYISKFPWLVYEEKNQILGYAYAVDWKSRAAYRQSVESTVYLRHGHHGKGIGSMLYSALLNDLKRMDVHTVIGGIGQPNESSIALHEKFGFEKVAHFKEIGYKLDRWVDVAYWQLVFK